MVTRFVCPRVWAEGKNILIFHPGSDENSIGDHHKSKEGIKGRILHHGSHAVRHFLSCPRPEKWQATTTFWDNGWFSKRGWPANSPYISPIFIAKCSKRAPNKRHSDAKPATSIIIFYAPLWISGVTSGSSFYHPHWGPAIGGCRLPLHARKGPPASERVFWLANFLREIWASAESVHAFSFRSWLAKLT